MYTNMYSIIHCIMILERFIFQSVLYVHFNVYRLLNLLELFYPCCTKLVQPIRLQSELRSVNSQEWNMIYWKKNLLTLPIYGGQHQSDLDYSHIWVIWLNRSRTDEWVLVIWNFQPLRKSIGLYQKVVKNFFLTKKDLKKRIQQLVYNVTHKYRMIYSKSTWNRCMVRYYLCLYAVKKKFLNSQKKTKNDLPLEL